VFIAAQVKCIIQRVKVKKLKLIESEACAHNSEIDEKFHQLDIVNIANVLYWAEMFDMVKDIKGDIVECGVGRGRSLVIISAINYFLDESEGGNRRIFGYDSFEGFPKPTKEDRSIRNPREGEWSRSPSGAYKYSVDFTELVLREAGVLFDDCKPVLTKGFFCDTLVSHPDRPIAILHIDGDLYQSYLDTLNLLYKKVNHGGIIIFDDFFVEGPGNKKFPGARRAVEEFLGDKFSLLETSTGGTYYYIKE